MIDRARAEQAFHAAVRACDPAAAVARAWARGAMRPGGDVVAIAAGKAAAAMARGLGPVARGLAVVVADDGAPLPAGWQLAVASHPVPDARSVAAGEAALALVASARPGETVVALISGGASALLEAPRVPLADLVALTRALMAAGAPIDELNTVRGALSRVKAGGLARASPVPVHTLVASDVIGDRLDVIGSGPTIGPWLDAPNMVVDTGVEARRVAATAILARRGLAIPAGLATPRAPEPVARDDRAELVLPMRAFAEHVAAALGARLYAAPITGDVEPIAARLVAEPGLVVAWGEPTPALPDGAGEGGRAQQLALALARHLHGTERAALVAGSDGIDGPPPHGRPAPAGAYVDGTSWARLADPAGALARCDAGPALASIGALFVTGPTGVNHADVVVLG